MIVRLFILFPLFFTSLFVVVGNNKADSTIIYGTAPSYAGLNLLLEFQSNIIQRTNTPLATFFVSKDGRFKASFTIPSTLQASVNLGQIKGTLILQPGGIYKLELPPYQPLSDADRLNPFYSPPSIGLAIVEGDSEGLNRMVSLFDDEFDSYYTSHVYKLFKKESEKAFLPIIAHLDSIYSSSNKWFNQYKRFTYHKLYDLSFQRNKEFVIRKFFNEDSFQLYNPAYITAFNSSFHRFLSIKFGSTNSSALKAAWRSRSIDSISLALKSTTILINDSLREAVMLKNIYDAYYSDLYDQEEILALIEKGSNKFITTINRQWACEAAASIKKLRVGSPAPNFVLVNGNGKERSLKKYRGKFIYLNFMDTRNFSCTRDLLALQEIHNRTKRDLEIVTIVLDKDFDKAKEFMKSNKLDWEILSISNQTSLLADYTIRVLPTYFLLDPNGLLLLSPAPRPEEGFLLRYDEQSKSFINKELRKSPPKLKSIFDL